MSVFVVHFLALHRYTAAHMRDYIDRIKPKVVALSISMVAMTYNKKLYKLKNIPLTIIHQFHDAINLL